MVIYFVTTTNREELEVIKEIKPPNVLISYWYFKNKPLSDFCSQIGYKPNIMLDSGAYSAFTKKKSVNIIDYMRYIGDNKDYLTDYVALDVIGNTQLSIALYELMKKMGYDPIPVYHYGETLSVLYQYINCGETKIALGGTVPIKNKTIVATWCNDICTSHQNVRFHLLGSTSKEVLENSSVASCDSSSWYMLAVNGFPKEIVGKTRDAKIERAKYQMRRLMELSS
jgi:hypothetical protein